MRENMPNNNYRTAAAKVEKVAQKLDEKGHSMAEELHKIAAFLLKQSAGQRQAQAQGFDPSSMYNIQQMSGGGGQTDSDTGGGAQVVDNGGAMNYQHTCSVTFEAPPEVKEHNMMNFILGIEDALGVKVVKFSWSVAPPKQAKASTRRAQAEPGFDPSSMYNIEQMSGGSHELPSAGGEAQQDDSPLNPNIDSYVKMKQGPMVSNANQHTCSVTFEAPANVKEHNMMNFILGIEDALGVKVVKFSWSVAPPKAQKI